MKRTLACLASLLLVANFSTVGIVTAAKAQVIPPLVMLKNGDLFSWSPESKALSQLTNYGFHRRPVISPDGRTLAFNSWTLAAANAITAGKFNAGDGDFPSDIILLDLVTGQQRTITTQPVSISVEANNVTNAISRSNPTWSPDGLALAWTEVHWSDHGTISYHIATYTVATDMTQVIVDDLPGPTPSARDGVRTLRVLWGAGGIAVYVPRIDSSVVRQLQIYNADGSVKQVIALEDSYYDFMWVNDAGKDYLGVLYYSKPWTLIDPATAATMPMDGVPELYAPQAGQYSIFVRAKMTGKQGAGLEWSASSTAAAQVTPLNFQGETNFAHRITISPQGVAYVFDAVYVWKDGQVIKIDGTTDIAQGWSDVEAGAIVWGATAWRIRH